MSDLLDGRIALVAGDDAIGQGIATCFARAGASVTLSSGGDGLADGLDVLVINLLSAPAVGTLEQQTEAGFEAAMKQVTLSATLLQRAFPLLRASGDGRIIVIGHRYGTAVNEGIAPYNSAAWALNGLVRSAAIEWGQYGITTNLLLPFAATPELAAARDRRPAIIDRMTSQLPLARAGDPIADIGGAALFLASGDARFINGQVVHADGGQHVAGPVLSPMRFA